MYGGVCVCIHTYMCDFIYIYSSSNPLKQRLGAGALKTSYPTCPKLIFFPCTSINW